VQVRPAQKRCQESWLHWLSLTLQLKQEIEEKNLAIISNKKRFGIHVFKRLISHRKVLPLRDT